jgi:hypothetical protein
MSDNKLFQKLLAGSMLVGTLFPNLSAEAKPNVQSETIAQAQKEPTFREDLRRYGSNAKKAGRRVINNFKERRIDYILREAKERQATQSKTERCRDKIKKVRELNK